MVNVDPAWADPGTEVYNYPYLANVTGYAQPPPVEEPPPPKSYRGRGFWVIGIAVLVLIIIAGIGTWAIVSEKQPEVTSVPPPALTVNQRIKQWRVDASPDIMTVSRDMDAIESAARINDVPGFQAACVVWQVDIKQLRTHLPSPDLRLTTEVSAALDDYDNASVVCQHADTTADVTVMMQYKNSGDVHIRAATEILNAAEK